jgi:hypothetical protein
MRIPADSQIRGLLFGGFPLPPGEGGAAAPGEGSPPHDHDSAFVKIVGRAPLIRRYRATFSQREKDCPFVSWTDVPLS